jgi:phage anti-repressor protein
MTYIIIKLTIETASILNNNDMLKNLKYKKKYASFHPIEYLEASGWIQNNHN